MRIAILLVAVLFALSACNEKKEAAPQEAPAPAAKEAPKAAPAAPVAKADPAPAAAPAGPVPSNDKEMLGLELKGFGAWKPVWDPDAKVAKWENEDVFTGIVIRVVDDKLDTMDDLKKAAPMMMQLGTAIEEVVEQKKTDKGWWAIVKRDGQTEMVYMQKYGGVQIVCSANLTKSDMGTIAKADAFKACESIALKK